MATTGEKLVELSSLSTGTALEHLLAITTGGGGTGETIIVDMIRAEITPNLESEVEAELAATVADELDASISEDIDSELDDTLKGDIDP